MEAAKKTSQVSEAFPMNGGDGRYSYANNSSLQRADVESSKAMIEEAIAEKLDIENLSNDVRDTFRIADLGCSVGPNTFIAVQSIIEAITLKFKSQAISSLLPEFHVFFNDHTSNDFNTLFHSLPEGRRYFAAGVPGSFYTRLFPRASLHFIHCSTALQWLSKVPKEVLDVHSPAWNKGRIHYANAPTEVKEAYAAQFVKDMDTFLFARAQEVVCGGLMGTIDEAKVDDFNSPLYFTSSQEVEAVVERNGCFSVERVEVMLRSDCTGQGYGNLIRAVMEPCIKQHFGSEIIDQLFDLYSNKLVHCPSILESATNTILYFLLKRNGSNANVTDDH